MPLYMQRGRSSAALSADVQLTLLGASSGSQLKFVMTEARLLMGAAAARA